MPAKKKRPAGPDRADDSTAWRIILERIEAQNHTTLEAVHTSHHRLADQMREFKEQVNARFETLETVVRSHSVEIRSLKTDVARVETKVDKLVPLEERVAALERRGA